MVRRIFGHKRDEIVKSWTKSHIEELHNFYSSPNIIYNSEVNDDEIGM
jgi:hypothetical protein